MKVLIIGKDNIMKWPQNTQKGFDKLGHETKLFLYNKKNPFKSFYKDFFPKKYDQILEKQTQKIIDSFKPELIVMPFVFFTPLIIFKTLPKNINKIGWVGDQFNINEKQKADSLNYLMCMDTGYIKKAKELKFKCKTAYLPHAFNPELFQKENEFPNRKMNAFFVGIPNPKRNELLRKIKEKCHIFGKRWNKKELPQHEIKNNRIPLKKLSHYYNNCNIAITMNNPINNINGMNMRIFEASACGALVATDNIPDLNKCYTKDEVAIYNSPEELNNIIKRMKNNDPELIQMAEKGYQKAYSHHTYEKRMQQLLDLIK